MSLSVLLPCFPLAYEALSFGLINASRSTSHTFGLPFSQVHPSGLAFSGRDEELSLEIDLLSSDVDMIESPASASGTPHWPSI